MRSDFDALVAGHICLDILPDLRGNGKIPFEKTFLPGRLVDAGPASFFPGGAVSNTGLALNRLGIATRLAGKVGADPFGAMIREIISSYQPDLDEGIIIDPSAITSYSVVINYPGVDRIFVHCPGANDTFLASDIPFALLEHARLFHFGYPPIMHSVFVNGGAQLIEIFQRAKQTGITTSMDMALPDPSSEAGLSDWRAILKHTLPYVDIFLPSVEEILFMLHGEKYRELSSSAVGTDILAQITPQMLSDLGQELISMGVKIVGLKLGDRGMYLRTGSREVISSIGKARLSHPERWADVELWAPCFKVNVVGTTGSGDATIAGFLAGLLRDLPIEQTLTMAVAVGACNVESSDALSGIRPWQEITQRIISPWERQQLMLDAQGWKFERSSGLWRGPCV